MRTTLTLDDDVADALGRIVRERGVSFKDAVNSVIRAGLAADKAALAIEHGAQLCSADADFSRFPGLRWVDPLR